MRLADQTPSVKYLEAPGPALWPEDFRQLSVFAQPGAQGWQDHAPRCLSGSQAVTAILISLLRDNKIIAHGPYTFLNCGSSKLSKLAKD